MKRREFITFIGGAAVTWPLALRAQQPVRMRRIGVLLGAADDLEGQGRVMALKQGLQELGWADGRNIQIDTRFAGADVGRIRTDAAELAALGPDVIVASTTLVVRALREATSSVPIVFAALNDPVDQGFIFELGASGRQHHWSGLDRVHDGREMFGDAQRGVARRCSGRSYIQSEYGPILLRLSAFAGGRPALIRNRGDGDPCSRYDQDRRGYREAWARARKRPDRSTGPVHHCPSRIDHEVGDAPPATCRVCVSVIRRARCLNVVRTRSVRDVPALSFVCRSHLKGVKPADLPVSSQPSTTLPSTSKPRRRSVLNTADAARPRRRGDRVKGPLLHSRF